MVLVFISPMNLFTFLLAIYAFFGKTSIHILCPYFSWIVCFLILSYMSLDINTFNMTQIKRLHSSKGSGHFSSRFPPIILISSFSPLPWGGHHNSQLKKLCLRVLGAPPNETGRMGQVTWSGGCLQFSWVLNP